jgi:formylglycine-generating enzyme required for sulfatase activity
MAGNVDEWTSKQGSDIREIRGGCFSTIAELTRAAARSVPKPDAFNDGLGFRLVRAFPSS